MSNKYDASLKNKTWSLVYLLPNRKVDDCKWIFKIKRNLNCSISRYKANFLAKGLDQQVGFYFTKIFSLVVKPITIRVVLTIALATG